MYIMRLCYFQCGVIRGANGGCSPLCTDKQMYNKLTGDKKRNQCPPF